MRIRNSITAKLYLAVLCACILVLLLQAVTMRVNFQRGFAAFLDSQAMETLERTLPKLEAAYQREGNWEFLTGNFNGRVEVMRPVSSAWGRGNVLGNAEQMDAPVRIGLLDQQMHHIAGNPGVDAHSIRLPIMVNDAAVGWLAMVPIETSMAPGVEQFLEDQRRTWWFILIACFMVAGLITFPLTRTLRLRLRHLADGTQAMTQGKFSTRVPVGVEDELGRLAHDFNGMAQALEHSDRSRRNLMTDISHDLRAGISVMRAEVESMRDGVRPPDDALGDLERYTHQLGRLVDDMHELNMTDAGTLNYCFEAVELDSLVMQLERNMRPRFSQLRLKLKIAHYDERVMIRADPRRILQLLENLLENSLRWTDPGGMVELRYAVVMETVIITLENSGAGVDPAVCKKLFDRFHRIDSPRLRAAGGSGLALAICRNIVEAHQGVIAASPSRLGGLMITLCIPTFAP
ncbi:TPA: HAMP domain-containing protein [Pseudomonas aeruginosa]|nr:HAMP domain-containing protein [Pseudomonas aeruginosa]